MKQIQPRIDQTHKMKPEPEDFAAIESQIADIDKRIADIDLQIADVNTAIPQAIRSGTGKAKARE